MALGERAAAQQEEMWVATCKLRSPGHPFYERLNQLLAAAGFDAFAEAACAKFYAGKVGRPGTPAGVYFRCLLIGYFEGLDSERGIAWRAADSISLRRFLTGSATAPPPDHSTISRPRRLIDVETHREVFDFVLALLAKEDLLDGQTLGVDATTLEANAALRSIVRRDAGENYTTFLTRLAKASGIATPTRADLARLDRKRPKKGSNEEWEHPHDPDAAIAKMKDGRTHLAHKAEHAVDLKTGAVVAVTVQGADEGDTESLPWTVIAASERLAKLQADDAAAAKIHDQPLREVVADKGYHSNDSLIDLEERGIRPYVSEPERGQRNGKNKERERDAVYANRRRVKGARGRRLLRRRGELLERPFAHYLDTGGLRRVHLRGRGNILKRLLVHVSAFNLGLLMRRLCGYGTPRSLQGLRAALLRLAAALHARLRARLRALAALGRAVALASHFFHRAKLRQAA